MSSTRKKDGRTIRYVFVEWTEPKGSYRGGNYPESDLEVLLDSLKSRGIKEVFLDDSRKVLDGN